MGPYVKKISVPARVSQPNLQPRDGNFLLFPLIHSGDRPETLLELLNSRRTVIPFILAETSEVLLLTRLNIDWVVIHGAADPSLLFPAPRRATREQRVDLRLLDETHVNAIVQWNSPKNDVRLSDFLNEDTTFIAARTDFGTLLINKFRVRETQVIDGAAHNANPAEAPDPPEAPADNDDQDRHSA